MRAYEHEVHAVYRRRDLSLAEKRERRAEIQGDYGFLKP